MSVVNLAKGQNISLSKEAPGLKSALIGLGWDERTTDGAEFDLDASAFLLGENEEVRSTSDFIFYGNLEAPDGSVIHDGDNRTGEGDGDDESMTINLEKIAADVKKIVITVTIHEAENRKQNFGQVANSFIRVVDANTNSEITRYDLGEDYSTETAMIFGELYRHNSEWKFRAVGQGYAGGLLALCQKYKIDATA